MKEINGLKIPDEVYVELLRLLTTKYNKPGRERRPTSELIKLMLDSGTIGKDKNHVRCRLVTRLEVLIHYSKDPPECACCSESTPHFLCIDHIDGGGSRHRKIIGGSIFYYLKNAGYPEGYRVLCWNCNAAIAYYGRCPHEDRKELECLIQSNYQTSV